MIDTLPIPVQSGPVESMPCCLHCLAAAFLRPYDLLLLSPTLTISTALQLRKNGFSVRCTNKQLIALLTTLNTLIPFEIEVASLTRYAPFSRNMEFTSPT